ADSEPRITTDLQDTEIHHRKDHLMTTTDSSADSVGATGIDRAARENRDANDPLRAFREEFLLPPETIYLDGNSLGPRPKGAAERAQEVIAEEWGSGLIKSWNTADWFGLPVRLGQTVSEIIGGGSGSAVV